MIKLKCPQCDMAITVADEHAGKKGRCPGCKTVFPIPAHTAISSSQAAKAPGPGKRSEREEAAVIAKPGRKPAPAPTRKVEDEDVEEIEEIEEVQERPRRKAAARLEEDEEDDRPRRKAARLVDDDEEEDRLKRKRARDEDEDDEEPRPKKKKRKKRRGDYADCPECGRSDAERVSYTWWGGFIGPLIISHVRCRGCGTCYNGKHGDYNTGRILMYYGICFAIGFVFFVIAIVLG